MDERDTFELKGIPDRHWEALCKLNCLAAEIEELIEQKKLDQGASSETIRMLCLAKNNLEQTAMWFNKAISRTK